MKSFKFLCTLLMIFVCGTVYATDDKVSISITDKDGNSELTVAPGKSVDVYINAKNTGAKALIVSTTMSIKLPEGFEYDGTPELVEENWNCPNSIVTFDLKGGVWYISVDKSAHTDADITFAKSAGQMYKFTLKATSAVASETPYTVTIDQFYTSDAGGTEHYVIDDYEGETLDFNVTVAEASAETETVTLTKEYNTYVPTKALDFSGVEGIKAYYVTAVTATEATLTETTTVAAGEGIIISGTPDTYEVPVATTEVAKSTTNKLATGTVAEGDYILFDGKFVPCTGGTLPDGKAYLPKSAISTSSAKALILGFGDATGINEAKAAKADGAIYSISGVRVAQPQKGVYIMNGRKVIVK
jgi:hypothetical protein